MSDGNIIIEHLTDDQGTYFHNNMSSQKSIVSENVMVANVAIMGNVTRPHD